MTNTRLDGRAVANQAALEWLAPLELGRPDEIAHAAVAVAAHFGGETQTVGNYGIGRDHAYVDLQPGNGTAYRIHVTLLPEEFKRSLGYDLLVALPDFGACLPLDAHGFHVPHYVAEKVRLNEHGNRILAAFTTILSANLEYLRTP